MERILYAALCCEPQAYGLIFDGNGYVECDLLLDNIYRKEAALMGKGDLKRIASRGRDPFYEVQGRRVKLLQV